MPAVSAVFVSGVCVKFVKAGGYYLGVSDSSCHNLTRHMPYWYSNTSGMLQLSYLQNLCNYHGSNPSCGHTINYVENANMFRVCSKQLNTLIVRVCRNLNQMLICWWNSVRRSWWKRCMMPEIRLVSYQHKFMKIKLCNFIRIILRHTHVKTKQYQTVKLGSLREE